MCLEYESDEPHVYLSEYYRPKRNDADNLILFDEEHDGGYDTGDTLYYNKNTGEDHHSKFRPFLKDWVKVAHQAKLTQDSDPFHLDVYRLKMSKPYAGSRRLITKEESSSNNSRSRIRALEERLRHIEEMKETLKKRIRQLQRMKEREHNAQMRMEDEVSSMGREWSDIDRFNHDSYKPLSHLGDTSRLL